MLERNSAVEDYVSLPETIQYKGERDTWEKHTPCFKATRFDGGTELHDYYREPDGPISSLQRIPRRVDAMREVCEQRGWDYVLHTPSNLPNETGRANLFALAGYRARSYGDREVAAVATDILSARAPSAPRLLTELTDSVAERTGEPQARVIGALCHLMWRGDLAFDLSQLIFDDGALMPEVRVWLPLSPQSPARDGGAAGTRRR